MTAEIFFNGLFKGLGTFNKKVTLVAIKDKKLGSNARIPINEPIAWYGPIVMNTHAELRNPFDEFNDGTFVKHS